MARRYESFTITGVANTTTFDSGITSTKEEPKKLLGLLIHLSGWAANIIELWLERERLMKVYDYNFPTDEGTGGANTQKCVNREAFIELQKDIPEGQTLKAAINCGATNKNVHGSYVYDLKE